MVDKDCFMFVEVIILLIKEWTNVYSLFDFCTIGLGLCLDASLPCTHLFSVTLREYY